MDARLDAPAAGLVLVGRRPPLGEYLVEAWRRRQFAITLAGHRLIGSLLQNRLGVLWIVLKPLLTATIYGTIFGLILSGSARPDDWVPYLITGVFIFEFFTGCFGNGARAITGNTKLVQSFGFPRILLPVATVIEQTLRLMQTEYFYPAVGDRFSPKEWNEKGKPDILGRAIAEKKRILAERFPRHIPRSVDDSLRARFGELVKLPRSGMTGPKAG